MFYSISASLYQHLSLLRTWIILYIYLSLSTLIQFILRPSLYTISLSFKKKSNTWQYFKFRGIVIMLSYIISYLIYYDQLCLNDSVFFTLHLYHLNLLFISRYFSLSFPLCKIFIQFFCPLILCPLTFFWLSYSVSQSNYQSSRFFYPFVVSLSLPLSSPASLSLGMSRSLSLSFFISIFA